MADTPDEVVATLVQPDAYVQHLNRVVAVTRSQLVFLRRKFVSRAGHELVTHPLDECARIRHVEERPIWTMVSGALLVALVAFVVVMLVVSWNDLEPQTRVPVGALALAGIWGVRRVVGARRHRLVFTLRDGTKLTWTSRPGELELKKAAVANVVELARARQILEDTRLVRS